MKIKTKVFVGAACLLAVAAFAAQDTFKLEWKPKVGETLKYQIDVKASMDMGGTMGDIAVSMVQTQKVTKIEDGKVTMEGKTGNMTLVLNGEDITQVMGNQDFNSTTVYNLKGELISITSDQPGAENQTRMENAYSMSYPNKEVKAGESWTRTIKGDTKGAVDATGTFTVEGVDMIGTDRTLRIRGDYKETAGSTPMTVKSTVWIREKDGAAVKGTFNMKNVEFQPDMPPIDATATMKLIP